MKTRVGFVSNSSASSFIIFFEREPHDLEDLHKLLFPKGTSVFFDGGYNYDDDGRLKPISTMDVAKAMWQDVEKLRENFKTTEERIWYHLHGYNTREELDDVWWNTGMEQGEDFEELSGIFDAIQGTRYEDASPELLEGFRRLYQRLYQAAVDDKTEAGDQTTMFAPATDHAYGFCYGSGCSAVEAALFSESYDEDFLDNVHLVLTMTS
jgi:hypothetical protein